MLVRVVCSFNRTGNALRVFNASHRFAFQVLATRGPLGTRLN
ncbi:hypothetical protein EC9_10510 [Rosistilla ulvae]|uniref:Uncharacterized protein n=1 Tax=Rosistilla ulvae TaxID=1930277 RepID=A0A517LW82_9BACT|nr:hypothetical protein EC9_10510 [Rosistilla ulvae]